METNKKTITMINIAKRARADIITMKPYSSARFLIATRPGTVFLDANECPYEPVPGVENYARYQSQQPEDLRRPLANLYEVATRNLLVTRGADEAIDTLIRTFCEPTQDNIIICPPTFAMYAMAARIHKTNVIEIPLRPLNDTDMQPDIQAIKDTADKHTKIIFICSPNNPTGTRATPDHILDLCQHFKDQCLIAVDETYIEFSEGDSLSNKIENFNNLVIFRTTSKAYATAGIRFGGMIAHSEIIKLTQKILPPYPIPTPTIDAMRIILRDKNLKRLQDRQKEIVQRRDTFIQRLRNTSSVQKIYKTETNFVLVQFTNAAEIMQNLMQHKIIVRDMSAQPGLQNCLRISIGSEEDMTRIINIINNKESALESDSSTYTGAYTGAQAQRTATITRTTKETAISVSVNLDKNSPVSINTGIGFYDHMLDQIAKHSGISLHITCDGDTEIDSHHTIEDCAIALGQALHNALGDKIGVARYGAHIPMDESLAHVAMDLSGRPYLVFKGRFPERMVGEMPTDMVEHFFKSLSDQLKATLHIEVSGNNTHHMVEACFKGFARALKQAITLEGHDLPSTKGQL